MKWADQCEHRSSWAVRPASPKAPRAGLWPLVKFVVAKGCVSKSELGVVEFPNCVDGISNIVEGIGN